MILLLLFLGTVASLGLCAQRGMVSDNAGASQAIAAGLGAGLGVSWRFALGLGDTGFIFQALFTVGGVAAMFGAYRYGQRIRRLRAEAAANPETFE